MFSPRPHGEVMSSATVPDRSARERILDAAITRFAASGVAGTSVRAIAAEAEVSPALVIHHFGSKQALRVACDHHVAGIVRASKSATMRTGIGFDPIGELRNRTAGPPLLAYLARTLVDGSPEVAGLVDELVTDAVTYMAEGEAAGLLVGTDDAYGRAVVMTLWSLGALVLHEHAGRLLGVDLTGDPAESLAYFRSSAEILGRGLIAEDAYQQLLAGFDRAEAAATETADAPREQPA